MSFFPSAIISCIAMVLSKYYPALIIIFLAATAAYPGSDHVKVADSPKTTLKLRLWGTITGGNINSYAIIEDIATRRQRVYKKGDEIQNATVVLILREKVALKIDDRFEILEIETGRPDVGTQDEYGATALIDASFKGQKDIVELLIIEGADLDARDNMGNTALMNAALKGHIEIVQLLVSNGADVSLSDKSGNTALIDSAKYARKSTCDIIAFLKDNGARINAENRHGLTAIIYAAQGGHAANVACLIAAGADVNAKSKSGETALKFAEMNEHQDVYELLRENGALE